MRKSTESIRRKAQRLMSMPGNGRCLLTALLFSAALLFSCDADNEYDTDHRCFFTFDTSLHITSFIKNALNPLAPGIFVWVYTSQKSGVMVVNAQLNDGKTSSADNITPSTASAPTA